MRAKVNHHPPFMAGEITNEWNPQKVLWWGNVLLF
jgi:hypothetical protein